MDSKKVRSCVHYAAEGQLNGVRSCIHEIVAVLRIITLIEDYTPICNCQHAAT